MRERNSEKIKCQRFLLNSITLEKLFKIALSYRIASSWGQFHQCVYAQLLCAQIPKAQKAAGPDCLFGAFGICMH